MSDSTQQTSLFDVTGKKVTLWADASYPNNEVPDAAAGCGCVIKRKDADEPIEIQGRIEYDDTPNEPTAEYEAIIKGIEWVCSDDSEVGVLQIYNDVEPVVEQIGGNYDTNVCHLRDLKDRAHRLLSDFEEWHTDWQSKEQSVELQRANELAKEAAQDGTQ